MKAKQLGFLSAVVASTCCALPLGLALLGLGGLGLGSAIGAYHWHLIAAAVLLLAAAWGYFLREKRRMQALGADVKNERTTRTSLALATAIVAAFAFLHLYTALAAGRGPTIADAGPGEVITLPVRGMDCPACQLSIEANIRKIPGVIEAHASAAKGVVVVKAKPGAVSLAAIAAAVRAAGYEPAVEPIGQEG